MITSSQEADEWIYNGSSLLSYNKKRNEASRYKAASSRVKELKEVVSIVMDLSFLVSRYKIESSVKTKKNLTLIMTPIRKNEIEKIDLNISLQKNYIEKLQLFFRGGNHSTFLFSNQEPSQSIDLKELSLPKNTKIIDVM